MFRDWSDFYLLAGSAAALLIGLVFVVVTLMSDRPRSSVLYGSKVYMGPVVLHMTFVLVLSAAALAPGLETRHYAVIAGVIGAWGLARGIYSIMSLLRLQTDGNSEVHWTDTWYYGFMPSVVYIAMGAVAVAFWIGIDWAPYALAAVIAGLTLLSIRDEYDLVTWLAPRPDEKD